jgi:hypothetical protein
MVVIYVSAMVPRLSLFALLLFPVALLHAHHSAAAEFDTSKPVTLRGKVTKVDWMNPHVFIWVDVPDASGAVTNWQVETVAPNYLRRLGWTKQSLKTGDIVTIQAFHGQRPAAFGKDGRRHAARRQDGHHRPSGRRRGHPSTLQIRSKKIFEPL